MGEIISLAKVRDQKGRRRAPRSLSQLTMAQKERLQALLLRDISRNMGIDKEMEAKFGVLKPLPGDEALRASAPGFMAKALGLKGLV